ncbi:MAG TPA: GNAT family N-acetyltransferase [Burkholderiales bacterium]|nr:GNAT family N-acetyltransferase [Burkholderiales bacterium]
MKMPVSTRGRSRCGAAGRLRESPHFWVLPGGGLARRSGPADASAIAELFQSTYQCSSHPFQTVADVERFLADERNFQILTEEGGRIVASMAMAYNDWNDSYELGRAITHPDYRRQGLAALLMQRVVDWVCDQGLGQVFFGFPRARRIVELCAAIHPRMIVVGHDAGRNVANASRETHLIVFSIPPHSSFAHVKPAVCDTAQAQFVDAHIYRPLGLRPAPGAYPLRRFAGVPRDGSFERNGFVLDYDPAGANGALEVLAHDDTSSGAPRLCRDLSGVLQSLPGVQHATVTILADKVDVMRHLGALGFEMTAYLPAWLKENAYRYDCVQMTRAAYASRPAARGYEPLVDQLNAGFAATLACAPVA